jgi:hypothetical protein
MISYGHYGQASLNLLLNVTSPTCIRELDTQFNLNIAGVLFDAIEQKIKSQKITS